jgi:hypothetical protein
LVFRRSSFSDQSFKADSFEFGDDIGGTAQGQTTTGAGTVSVAITGSATTAQGQTATASGVLAFSGTANTAQGQSNETAGTLAFTGAANASQGQSIAGTGAQAFSGAATTAQAQAVDGAATLAFSGAAGTAQGQAADGAGTVLGGITGFAETGQAQGIVARGFYDEFLEPIGVGADARIARRRSESDTFVPADVLAMRRLDEDEILLVMIARAVTSGALNQWH